MAIMLDDMGQLYLIMASFIGGLVLLAIGWALEKNNRVKVWRWLFKRNWGVAGIIGKGNALYKIQILMKDELMKLGDEKLYRIRTKDKNGNPLWFLNDGVPWIIFNEDKATPMAPMSSKSLLTVYHCDNCKKDYEDATEKKEGKTSYFECPVCESQVLPKEIEVIEPINPTETGGVAGQGTSLGNTFTVMEQVARIHAQGQLLQKLKEIGYMIWCHAGEIILLLVIAFIVWQINGNVQHLIDNEATRAVAQNITANLTSPKV